MRLEGLGNIEKRSVRFDFGSVKYGFTWAFPQKKCTNIGIGTFIGNFNIINPNLINNVVNDFGFTDKKFKPIYKRLRIWNGLNNIHNETVLAVGDAASLSDPFLAEGIRPSLLSSFYAAECIHNCLSKKTPKHFNSEMPNLSAVFLKLLKTSEFSNVYSGLLDNLISSA